MNNKKSIFVEVNGPKINMDPFTFKEAKEFFDALSDLNNILDKEREELLQKVVESTDRKIIESFKDTEHSTTKDAIHVYENSSKPESERKPPFFTEPKISKMRAVGIY